MTLVLAMVGCQFIPASETMAPANTVVITPQMAQTRESTRTVSLYYRFRGEDRLARETREITLPNDRRLDEILITMLLDGPAASQSERVGLFPPGTRLISITQRNGVVFVTLSREFLGTPADMPINWQDNRTLQEEVLLRRRLGAYAIINTLAENAGAQSMQLLIQLDGESQGIPRTEFYREERDDGVLLGPITREESMILTHYYAADALLTAWCDKNWVRLYRYITLGPPTGDAFTQEMDMWPISLLSYLVTPGCVSADGTKAYLTVYLDLIDWNGSRQSDAQAMLTLVLQNDVWKIEYESLRQLPETVTTRY